ncbi:MAG: class I SAM-dependent methyltransferase [Bacteroidota bacterium]
MNIKDYLITLASSIAKPSKRKLIGYCGLFRNKKGLEIGGPSALFSLKGYFPVYLFANGIDGVNYSNQTAWEGNINEGKNYHYYNKTGYQFIKEATDLSGIADESYDFILSCHSLEHVANPLKAIAEWTRVLKPGGYFVLVLPDKRYTFDVNRPYTTMDHLVSDFKQNTREDDTTHFKEILSLHERKKDDGLGAGETLEERLTANITHRYAHHHVFNFELINEILNYFSFKKIYQQEAPPFHLITLAQKAI